MPARGFAQTAWPQITRNFTGFPHAWSNQVHQASAVNIWRRKALWINGPLAVAVVAIAGVSYASATGGTASAAPQTSAVARGTVMATVSASGSLEPGRDLGLSFTTGGKVTAIDVRPGQRVSAGQVLARVDATSSRQSLATARASLAAAEAALTAAEQGETQAQKAAASAQAASAYAQVQSARSALSHERNVVAANRASLEQQVSAAQATLNAAQSQLSSDKSKLASDQAKEQTDCASDPSGSACSADKSAVASDQSQVGQDNSAVLQDTNSLKSAKANLNVGLAQESQSLAQAQQSVNTAQKSYQATLASNASNASPSQSQIAQDQATVTNDTVTLQQAQTSLHGTVLRAPVAGTVASITNNIGDYVSSGGSSSGSGSTGSSGSTSSGSGSSSTTSSSGGAATNPSGPGTGAGGAGATSSASGFIVLTDLSGLLVHADFAETDAAKIKIGAGAAVTVNALPNDNLSASVAQVDPTSTTSNSVVQYGVTLTLSKQMSALRPGQSVSVSVITAQASNALYVPSSAVSTAGGQSTVRVADASGTTRTVSVTIGVQGDSSTQILSGLRLGQRVVTSAGSSGSGGFPAGGFPGGGGLGGGFGGGVGGR